MSTAVCMCCGAVCHKGETYEDGHGVICNSCICEECEVVTQDTDAGET